MTISASLPQHHSKHDVGAGLVEAKIKTAEAALPRPPARQGRT